MPARRLALFVAVGAPDPGPVPARAVPRPRRGSAALVGSRVLLGGGTLYVDFVDNRPPLLYVFYALGQALFGDGLPGVRLLTALVVLPLTALAASAFYRHDRRGLLAGLLYLVYGAAFFAHDMHSASPELLMLLPVAWALVLLRDEPAACRAWRLLLAGLLVGLGFLLRQQAALALPPLALAAWRAAAPPGESPRMSWRLLRIAALSFGFALPLGVTGLVFAGRGAAHELLFWTLVHNFGYAANPIAPREALERAASYLVPFALVTLPLAWAASQAGGSIDSRHPLRLLRWLLLFSLPAAFVGFRFFPHYFVPLYLPLALLAAPWTAAALGPPVAARWSFRGRLGAPACSFRVHDRERRPLLRPRAGLRGDAPGFPGRRPSAPRRSLLRSRSPVRLGVRAAALRRDRPRAGFALRRPAGILAGYVPGNRGSHSSGRDKRALVSQPHWDQPMRDLDPAAAASCSTPRPRTSTSGAAIRWRVPRRALRQGGYYVPRSSTACARRRGALRAEPAPWRKRERLRRAAARPTRWACRREARAAGGLRCERGREQVGRPAAVAAFIGTRDDLGAGDRLRVAG